MTIQGFRRIRIPRNFRLCHGWSSLINAHLLFSLRAEHCGLAKFSGPHKQVVWTQGRSHASRWREGRYRVKSESRARSTLDLKTQPESRAKPGKKRGRGLGSGFCELLPRTLLEIRTSKCVFPFPSLQHFECSGWYPIAKSHRDLVSVILILLTAINNYINCNLLNEFYFAVSTTRRSLSYKTDPKLCNSVQCSEQVRGIVALNENVYVILTWESNTVHVFNSNTLAPEPSIPVIGLTNPCDIAGSKNVLHIGSGDGKIYRIELRDKSITSWSVGSCNGSVSLSVNKHGHVIASSDVLNNLYEYTSTGELRREIALKGDVVSPRRAVHMDGDQFLVCQVEWNSLHSLHRVCLIDNRGNLIRSFGNTKGSGEANLHGPFRLVVDRNGFILVADLLNGRVVLLNKQLEYVKDIIPASMNISGMFTLFLDEDNGRLYLSDNCNKKLAIFDLEARIWYG